MEAFGAALQVPAVMHLFGGSNGRGSAVKLSVLGCHFCALGLGVIVSTVKRKVRDDKRARANMDRCRPKGGEAERAGR
jgi:hypothetical protein